MLLRPSSAAACLGLLALALLPPAAHSATAPDLRPVTGSVRTPDPGGLTIGHARILRPLTSEELAAPMAFSVMLKMTDLAGLQARIAGGEQVGMPELEARYLPSRADYGRVSAWLTAQGFTPTLTDRLHMMVSVRGPVSAISRSLGVQFARVADTDGEYTSAISEPYLPSDLAAVVLSVNALQPQFRLRHVKTAIKVIPNDTENNFVYVTPDNVVSAYNIPPGATGAGQTIAIIGQAEAPMSDFSAFWTAVGSAQTVNNVTVIDVNGGPGVPTATSPVTETDLDVEWAGALAPAAQIRLYLAVNSLDTFEQISNDLPAFPGMRVISSSYGNTEANEGGGFLQSFSQFAAAIAAQGVSILSASGDSGSNPDPVKGTGSGDFTPSAPLAVTYPASDPSVTGVGGTTVNYSGNWAYGGEIVWNQGVDLQDSNGSASGGGVSIFFGKPTWQTGGSVLAAQTTRCVPDVSAISDADLTNVNLGPQFLPYSATDLGVLLYSASDPTNNGNFSAASGTSLATPVWAAITALINEARSRNGQSPIGALNPHLYPLAGTSVFNDVTMGTNGAYVAGPGYDLCTGLGTPNVANLIGALEGQSVSQRLVNIASRAEVQAGANILIAGLVIQGPAGSTKQVLVRGIGPALTGFSVAGALANPVVSVFDSNSMLIASDTGWSTAPVAGTSPVGATFRQATSADMASTGAFALVAGSADSAIVLTLPTGNYTVQVAGKNSTTGVALAEVYELDTNAPEVLQNISSRNFVGTGAQVAIPGFAVHGTQPAQLLIRGVGPALNGFGVTGTLAQPSIGVFDSSSTLIASNTGWGNAPVAGTSVVGATFRQATAADMKAVGAFSLTAGSADSALVLTLPPGSYTAIVSGVGGTTGVALAEVYELPVN